MHDDSQATAKRKAKTISWTTAERQTIIGADQEYEANERADRAARTVRTKRSKPADGSAQVELDQVPRTKKSERRALLKYEEFKWKSIVNKIRQFLPGRSDHQISLKGTALGLKGTSGNLRDDGDMADFTQRRPLPTSDSRRRPPKGLRSLPKSKPRMLHALHRVVGVGPAMPMGLCTTCGNDE